MALESKVLMVAISPSRPDAQADASAVEYRVDTFIEGLKMVTKQGVRSPVSPSGSPRVLSSADPPSRAECHYRLRQGNLRRVLPVRHNASDVLQVQRQWQMHLPPSDV